MPNPYSKLNVLIADGQFLIVEALKQLINDHPRYRVLDVVSDQEQLIFRLKEGNVNILTLDFMTLDMDGVSDVGKIVGQYPKLPILILTNQLGLAEFKQLSRIGIKTIILKSSDYNELFTAMAAAIDAKKFYSSDILDLIVSDSSGANRPAETVQLTPSEVEIVRLISFGYTTKEIAARKHLSFHTVMTHRKNIFRKLEVSNVSELLMNAMRSGLIDSVDFSI